MRTQIQIQLSTLEVLSTAIHQEKDTRRPSYIEAANQKRRLSKALLQELKPAVPQVHYKCFKLIQYLSKYISKEHLRRYYGIVK